MRVVDNTCQCGTFLFLVQGVSALVCLGCDSPAQLRRDAAQATDESDRAALLSVADREEVNMR